LEARAPIVAFLDADCFVRENWIDAICEAHRHRNLAVAGSVHNGSRSLASWAYYFCEFNLWTPTREPRQIREAPGCALSIKRAAFDRFGPFPEGSYCSDTVFHWRMQAGGEQVLFWPAIAVYHTYLEGWNQLLRHISKHRHHFAVMDSREHKWNRGCRLLLAASMPLLPFLLILAVAWRLRQSPSLYIPFVKAAPPTFLGFCARAWGQLIGYLPSFRKAA
jgi:GT2 family glycosyltransferase